MVSAIALATAIGGAGTAVTIGYIVAATVINLAIGALLGAILKPDTPPGARDRSAIESVSKNPVMPRKVCYGESILGGPHLNIETSGTDSSELKFLIAMTGHPIEDVIGVYIEDEYFNIAGEAGVTLGNALDTGYILRQGTFTDTVKIIKVLGWGFATPDYVSNTSIQRAVDDRARARLIDYRDDWEPPVSDVRDLVTGLYAAGRKATNCSYMYMKFTLDRDKYSGIPKVKFHIKGKPLYNPRLDGTRVSEGGLSGGLHRIDNPDTWEYSETWSLTILDYLLNPFYGLNANTIGTLSEIDWSEFIEATEDSDELVVEGYTGSAITEPRYRVNGVFETSSEPIGIVDSLVMEAAGKLIYGQGKYKLRAGVYKAPESPNNIINEDMILSDLTIRTHTPRAEIFNKVGGVYIDKGDPTEDPTFIPSDFPLVDPLDSSGTNPYETVDGEEIIKDIDLPYCIYETQAQRVARIALERVRKGLVIEFTTNMEVLKYSVGDNIYLEILSDGKYSNETFFDRLGLNDTVQNRPDSPMTPYYKQFVIYEMGYNEDWTINVVLVEEEEEIYEWSDGFANKSDYKLESQLILEASGATVMPPVFLLGSPLLAISEVSQPATTGTSITTLIKWEAPVRGSLTDVLDKTNIGSYILEYGIVTDSGNGDPALRVADWISIGIVPADKDVLNQGPKALENLYIDGSTQYDFRVRSVSITGRRSLWAYYSVDSGSDYLPTKPPSGSIVAQVYAYIRSYTTPATPAANDGSYNFATNTLTPPTSWFDEIQTGLDPLYVTTGTFATDTVGATSGTVIWSEPKLISNVNSNGLLFSSSGWTTPISNTMGAWGRVSGDVSTDGTISTTIRDYYGQKPKVLSLHGNGVTSGTLLQYRTYFDINSEQPLVFYAWVKRRTAATTSGMYIGWDDFQAVDKVETFSNVPDSNPYIVSGIDINDMNVGEWYLLVAKISANSATVNPSISGIYNSRGERVVVSTDYRWRSEANGLQGFLRTLFIAASTAITSVDGYDITRPQLWIEGTSEPTISQLLELQSDASKSTIVDSSGWTVPYADVMGDWKKNTGFSANMSINTTQLGPFNEYPKILSLRGDGVNTGWLANLRSDFVIPDENEGIIAFCWVKRISAPTDNGLYIGWATSTSHMDKYDTVADTNPYSINNRGNLLTVGEWYLCVCTIDPKNAVTNQNKAGVYDTAGNLVFGDADFRWLAGATNGLQYIRIGYYDNVGAAAVTDGYDITRPIVYRVDGTEPSIESVLNLAAQPGVDGLNTATLYGFKRSASPPVDDPGAVVYTFATGDWTPGNGWSTTPPAGANPLYIIVATAISNTATDSVAANEWTTPELYVQDGATGASGLNVATVRIYQRNDDSTTAPTLPSVSSTYTFSNGALTGLDNGWTSTVPTSGGAFLWTSQATASSSSSTDAIPDTEWATASIESTDGVNAANPGNALNLGRQTNNLALWYNDSAQLDTMLSRSAWSIEASTASYSGSMLEVTDTFGAGANEPIYSEKISVQTDKKYRASVYAAQPTGDQLNYLLVTFYDAAGDRINNSSTPVSDAIGWPSIGSNHYFGVVYEVLPTTRTLYTAEFGYGAAKSIPSNAVSMAIGGLFVRDGTTSTTVQLDDFKLEEIAITGSGINVFDSTGWRVPYNDPMGGWYLRYGGLSRTSTTNTITDFKGSYPVTYEVIEDVTSVKNNWISALAVDFNVDKNNSYRVLVEITPISTVALHSVAGGWYENGGLAKTQSLAGVDNTNPYAVFADMGIYLEAGKTYIMVCDLLPSNATASTGYSGIYDEEGLKVFDGTEYRQKSTFDTNMFRMGVWVANTTSTIGDGCRFSKPICQILDGNEHTVESYLGLASKAGPASNGILINGSFESGKNNSWNVVSGVIYEDGTSRSGTKYIRIPNGAGGPNQISARYACPAVGEKVFASGFARRVESNLPDNGQKLGIRFYDSAGTQLSANTIDTASTVTVGWQSLAGNIVVPSSAVTFSVDLGETAGVGEFDWDDVFASYQGATGAAGGDGLNVATVRIYQRSDNGNTAPTLPSASTTFTFSTGVLTGLDNGWQQGVPSAGGKYLWTSDAIASNLAATDAISNTEWNAATIESSDGNSAIIFDTSAWKIPFADPMGGWVPRAGVITNVEVVSNIQNAFNQYPKTMLFKGDGINTGWLYSTKHDFLVDSEEGVLLVGWLTVRSVSTTRAYLGWSDFQATDIVENFAGAASDNPYFFTATAISALTVGESYLVYSVLYPNSATSHDGVSGVYSQDGTQVINGADFRFRTAADGLTGFFRVGYNEPTAVSTSDGFLFTQARLYRMDGSHPSVEAELNLAAQPGADGINALSPAPTLTTISIACDSAGVPKTGAFTNANGTFDIISGTTLVTESSTFSIVLSNCTGTVSNTGGTKGDYAFTAMSANNAYADITATYQGASVTTRVTLNKVLDAQAAQYSETTVISDVTVTSYQTTGQSSVIDIPVGDGGTVKVSAVVGFIGSGGSGSVTLNGKIQYRATGDTTWIDFPSATGSFINTYEGGWFEVTMNIAQTSLAGPTPGVSWDFQLNMFKSGTGGNALVQAGSKLTASWNSV